MAKKNWPLVSIVTVNYNQTDTTLDLIDSLIKITYPNIELLVVDNDSPEADALRIRQKYPRVILVQSPINYGFAAGNNQGIMRARGKYVMILNNDVIVTPGFLEPLVEMCEENRLIGAISPKIRFYYEPQLIQFAGFTPIHPITMRNKAIGWREKDQGQYDTEGPTGFCHGAAMLVPMEVIRKVGMMSYIYFLYYEEADWCERIRKAGYQLWYTHRSLVYHKESVSTGKDSPLKAYYLTRNRIIFLRRNAKGKNLWLGILYQVLVAVHRNTLKYIMKGNFRYVFAFAKGVVWHFFHLRDPSIFENPTL